MRKYLSFPISILTLLIMAGLLITPSVQAAEAPPAGDRLSVAGVIKNPQGRGVKEVEIEVLANGQHVQTIKKEDLATGKSGSFLGEFVLPAGTLPDARVEVKGFKPSWEPLAPMAVPIVATGEDQAGNRLFQGQQVFSIKRQITPAFWIATIILLLVYAIISLEWMHRTLAALLGAALLLFISYTLGTFDKNYFVLSFEDAVAAIDMNVIFLLLAMMIFVGVMKKTGMFQWLAYKAYALAKGNVFILAGILMVITAVVSAFLDNVTTMLLMIPVTIEIAVTLKINPIAFMVPEAFASNVGGTATLIGDPPNILIGSYANLTFGDFVVNLTFICFLCLIVTVLYFLWRQKKDYAQADVKDVNRTIAYLQEEYRITDAKLMVKGLILLAFTIFLFIVHGALHMEPSVAALIGAMILLTISKVDIVEMLEHEVEWPTLIFFIALFMVIAAAEETGLIQIIAEWVRDMSRGNLTVAVVLVLWVSAIASAFIDNIPFTATMLPIVAFLNTTIPGAETGILWWSLALGACLGGNGTMIGASANVVTVGLAEKAGYHISFGQYMKACWWPMIITIVLCNIFLLVATFVRPLSMGR